MRRVTLIILILLLFAPEAGAKNKHVAHFKQTLNKFIESAKKLNPNLLEAKNRINIYKQIPRPEKFVERSHAYLGPG